MITQEILGKTYTTCVKPTNAALTVLTATNEAIAVHSFWITENGGGSTTIDVYLTNPSGTNYYIYRGITVPAPGRISHSDLFFINKGWSLKTDAGADSRLDMGITHSTGSATSQ